VNASQKPSIYLFGDNHRDPHDEVKERLHSVTPESAEALVMEHAEKTGGEEPSQWALLKNPSLLLMKLLLGWWQKRQRSASDRVTDGSQTSVAEEVAEKLDLEVEYTDLSCFQRFDQQPVYLTAASWAAVLLLFFGWVLHPFLSFLSILFIPSVALWTHRVYMRMRDEKMAEDLRRYGSRYSEIVFFAGDDHIDSVSALLDGELETVEKEESRP
jgi:hypothetical protein